MNEVLIRILDSELPALLSVLALIIGAAYHTIVVLPKLQRLKDLEESPDASDAVAQLLTEVRKLGESNSKVAADLDRIRGTFDNHQDTLDDIQYSCHNTRHELADVKDRLQNIASNLSTCGRDDTGFCDLRELR